MFDYQSWLIDSCFAWIDNTSTSSITRTNKRYRTSKGQSQIDNPQKMATYGTQDEGKQNKNTTQSVPHTTMRKQTQVT